MIALKKCFKILLSALLVVILSACAFYWAFFDLQRVDGQELLKQSDSPDGNYTVSVFLNNGGATTGYAVLCSVLNHQNGKEKNIYWNYPCSDAEIVWLDADTVNINGIALDINKDTYDYRHD